MSSDPEIVQIEIKEPEVQIQAQLVFGGETKKEKQIRWAQNSGVVICCLSVIAIVIMMLVLSLKGTFHH
jgi:hypothetical protein